MATHTPRYGFAVAGPTQSDLPRPSKRDVSTRLPMKSQQPHTDQMAALYNAQRQRTGRSSTSRTDIKNSSIVGGTASTRSSRQPRTSGNAYSILPAKHTVSQDHSAHSAPKVEDERLFDMTAFPASSIVASPDTFSREIPSSNTPSLVSGSSLSSQDSPNSTGRILRRKPSVIGQYKAERQTSKIPPPIGPRTIREVHLEAGAPILSRAEMSELKRAPDDGSTIFAKKSTLPALQIADFALPNRAAEDDHLYHRPTPVSEASTTPSLTYSASPSTFSQTTTATSRTPYSPLVSASPVIGPRWFTSPQKSNSKSIPRPKTTESDARAAREGHAISHPFFQQSESVSTSNLPRTASSAGKRQVQTSAEGSGSPSRKTLNTIPRSTQAIPGVLPVHPPELAHLNSVSQATLASTSIPPSRPSRNGTEALSIHQHNPHVVQSNLPNFNGPQHLRRHSREDASPNKPSQSSDAPVTQQKARSQSSISPKQSPAVPPSRHIPSLPRLATGKQADLTETCEKAPRSPIKGSVSEEAATKRKTKFGFFSRKSKPEVAAEKPEKAVRRGPVAGTGHEGYGAHTARGRTNSSSSTNTENVRSGSSGSIRSADRKRSGSSSKASDLDDFLQQRLTPVYMKGGGSSSGSQPRESGSFIDDSVFSPPGYSPNTPQTATSTFDLPKRSVDYESGPSIESKPSSDNVRSRGRTSVDQGRSRSASKTRSTSRKRLVKAPPKPTTPALPQAPVASNLLPAEYALGRPSTSQDRPQTAASQDEATMKAKKAGWSLFPKSSSNDKLVTKWNPFQRSKSQPSEPITETVAEPAAKEDLPPSDPLEAHYIPTEEEVRFDAGDLDKIMREAAMRADDSSSVYTDFEDLGEYVPEPLNVNSETALTTRPGVDASVSGTAVDRNAPSMDKVDPGSTTDTNANIQFQGSQQTRPSRLPQVGRIPKVVSAADRPRKLPSHSFSRPFADAQSRPSMQEPSSAKSANFPPSVRSMSPMKSDRLSQKTSFSQASSSSLRVPSSIGLKSRPSDASVARQFIDFGPRKNSDISFSSGSGTTMHFPTASTVAYGPGRNSALSMEETWPEFDDFIDHVMTPSTTSTSSPRSSNRATIEHKDYFNARDAPRGTGAVPGMGPADKFPRLAVPSSLSPSDQAGALRMASDDVRQLKATRSSSLDLRRDAEKPLKHKRSASLPENVTTTQPSEASQDLATLSNDHGNMALFRFRVLMTSKWLSFGRLLLSPAHDELGNGPDDRVLIMDGLGNRDWSYYCAVSYPNTQVYSLGPSPTVTSNRGSFGGFGHLPNHRHFSYAALGTDFPFPRSFFTAVVFRFPVATSEAILRSTISECKRVLRPGGHLEVSTLDLDMTNMGNLARRAVRNLKLNMHAADPEVSLKPASDQIQNILHRRGFENMNRCVVGVPAAGAIASPDKDFSELAQDDTKEGDASITKLVAQVGRWWYTRCYEMGVLPDGDLAKSMWCDGSLLRECEELGTTFKLLICHAQKPACAKRRTVSI